MTSSVIIDAMPRASAHGRLDRLDLIASRLKADEAMTVGAIAAEFGISARTLFRDLAILRERGLPVEADRGRGGGIRLHRTWGIGRLSLSYREAVELIVSLAIAERMQAPWLIARLSAVRRKLAASFAPAMRERIEGLRARIRIGRNASAPVVAGFAPPDGEEVGRLFEAFLEERIIRFRYAGADGREEDRRAEPQILMLNYPVWYVIGWDHARGAVRTFRVDRMRAVRAEAEVFRLRPEAGFAEALAGTGSAPA